MFLFKKKNALSEREKRVRRELADLQRDIKIIEKGIRNPRLLRKTEKSHLSDKTENVVSRSVPDRNVSKDFSESKEQMAKKKVASAHSNRVERLVVQNRSSSDQIPAYLASAIHANRPLRYEREKQRNKAILMMVVVALFALWFLFRLLLA